MFVASRPTDTPAADAAKLLIRLGLAILMIALPSAGVMLRGAIYVLMPIGAILILIGAVVGAPELVRAICARLFPRPLARRRCF